MNMSEKELRRPKMLMFKGCHGILWKVKYIIPIFLACFVEKSEKNQFFL